MYSASARPDESFRNQDSVLSPTANIRNLASRVRKSGPVLLFNRGPSVPGALVMPDEINPVFSGFSGAEEDYQT